jgi:hypothetical protein
MENNQPNQRHNYALVLPCGCLPMVATSDTGPEFDALARQAGRTRGAKVQRVTDEQIKEKFGHCRTCRPELYVVQESLF